MEVFRLLDKSNCGRCGEKTCLAFAGAVFLGRRGLSECPSVPAETIASFGAAPPAPPPDDREAYIRSFSQKVAGLDLEEAARRLGADFSGGRLTLKVLGKDVGVDQSGRIYSDIHQNPWVVVPFLMYVLEGRGAVPTGSWVSLRELKDGYEYYPLFEERCDKVFKKVADVYPDLFDDMAHLFGGKPVPALFRADISVVLHPFPRLPLMVCYWKPEDGMDSDFHVFFDETADRNLDIRSLFTLGAGIAQMFTKIAARHGFKVD